MSMENNFVNIKSGTGMPQDLILVRHGQSEGNVVIHSLQNGEELDIPIAFSRTHDWQYRLSSKGVDQAKSAGDWLEDQFGPIADSFNERYASPYMRARETALHLGGLATKWLLDDRLTERDWGVYNSVPYNERSLHFPHTEKMREISPLKWRPDGGEALMGEVLLRFRDWFDDIKKEQNGKRVLAVSHGELMWVARYVIEQMLPEEWEEAESDKSQQIYNCDIYWYSRVNPLDSSDVSDNLSWRRIIRPTISNQEDAPYGGAWVKLQEKRYMNGAELESSIKTSPRIFPEN